MSPLLEINGLSVRFGGLTALDDVSIKVPAGTVHGVIGPNGAGKTTLLNVVTGVYGPSGGAVRFEGNEISGFRTHRISTLGVARTFQNTELFGEMTARENVLVGLHRHLDYGLLAPMLRSGGFRKAERDAYAQADEILGLVDLTREADSPAGILALGQQRRLELARALASRPRLLMLDEPAAGLRSAELEDLMALLEKLRSQLGLTLVLIDHVMRVVMRLCDRITVLNYGRKLAEGTPAEIRSNPEVIAAYLGKARHA
jgi:branched-chain amino acid transport system ATP-binding protein